MTRRRPLLIAAEGLDRAGTDTVVDLLGRWLERKGLRVRTISWPPARTVRRAADSRRTRTALSPTVAALLSAAEAQTGVLAAVGQALRKRDAVLIDHYVWTEVARQAARGADRAWVAGLYAEAPQPDLVVYARQSADRALALTMGQAPPGGALAAAAPSFVDFLNRAIDGLDGLAVAASAGEAVPWPVRVVAIDADRAAAAGFDRVRAAARELLAARSARRPQATIAPVPPWRPLSPRGEEPVSQNLRAEAVQTGAATAGLASETLHEPAGSRGRGALIVLEGIDHAGRSTQAALLERQLRYQGRGVVRTSFGASLIAGDLLRRAKAERGSDSRTMLLLYAADLAERLDQIIRPALRAGLIVIADRYAFTPVARAAARGVDPTWARDVLRFAPPPDAVVLLDIVPAVAAARSQALHPQSARNGTANEDDYIAFQTAVSSVLFDDAQRLGFSSIDAFRAADEVERDVLVSLAPVLEGRSPARADSPARLGASA